MEIRWGKLRQHFSAANQKGVSSNWQALPLVAEAWRHGVSEHFIKAGFRDCGIAPWSPSELLQQQSATLFKTISNEEWKRDIKTPVAHKLLTLPDVASERKVPCAGCGAACPVWAKFCPFCGASNEALGERQALVLGQAPRAGYRRKRPQRFDLEALVQANYAGLRSVDGFVAGEEAEDGEGAAASAIEEGAAAAAIEEGEVPDEGGAPAAVGEGDGEAIPAEDAAGEGAGEEVEPPAEPEEEVLAPYDPPHYVAGQLKTDAAVRGAWHNVLIDVVDPKYRAAFLYWLPTMLPRAWAGIGKKGTLPEFTKTLLDKVPTSVLVLVEYYVVAMQAVELWNKRGEVPVNDVHGEV
jgi:hypothetical protein